jgi:CRISPR/Cas system endoribonuclease Cas6 (RAMP superfamily)
MFYVKKLRKVSLIYVDKRLERWGKLTVLLIGTPAEQQTASLLKAIVDQNKIMIRQNELLIREIQKISSQKKEEPLDKIEADFKIKET